MSIKIHTGFALTGTSLEETVVLVGRQREAIQGLVDTKNLKVMARVCATTADAFCLARAGLLQDPPEELEKLQKQTPLGYALSKVLDAQKETRNTLRRNPENDCDVLIRLFYDHSSRKMAGTVVEEEVGALRHLLAQPGIVAFDYFDNMERPDSVPQEEWELRSEFWGRTGDKGAGFEFSMNWQPNLPCLADVLPHLASFDERVRRMADRLTENAYMAENWKPASPNSLVGLYQVMRQYRKDVADAGSKWHQQLRATSSEIRKRLAPDLTGMLSLPLEEFPLR